jgi:hypothetical protein
MSPADLRASKKGKGNIKDKEENGTGVLRQLSSADG